VRLGGWSTTEFWRKFVTSEVDPICRTTGVLI
jgi:hypothetical protein